MKKSASRKCMDIARAAARSGKAPMTKSAYRAVKRAYKNIPWNKRHLVGL